MNNEVYVKRNFGKQGEIKTIIASFNKYVDTIVDEAMVNLKDDGVLDNIKEIKPLMVKVYVPYEDLSAIYEKIYNSLNNEEKSNNLFICYNLPINFLGEHECTILISLRFIDDFISFFKSKNIKYKIINNSEVGDK